MTPYRRIPKPVEQKRSIVHVAAVALACVAAALVLTLLLLPHIQQTQFTLFFAAVAAATWLGGARAGVAAMLLSVVAFEATVPGLRTAGTMTTQLLRDILFIAINSASIYIITTLERTRDAALRLADTADANAADLSEQMLETELQAGELEHVNRMLAEQTERARTAAQRGDQIQAFTGALLERTSAAGIAQLIVTEGRRILSARAAALGIPREDDTLDFIAAEGYPETQVQPRSEVFDGPTAVGHTLQTREPVWISNPAELVERFPRMAQHSHEQSRAWASLPLVVDQRLVGVVAFSFAEEHDFDDDDRAFMLQFAQQCAQALDRARLHDLELRARVRTEFAERRLAFLAEASARLGAALDEDAAVSHLADLVVPELADWCLIYLVASHGEPELAGSKHVDPAALDRLREIDRDYPPRRAADTMYGRVLRTGRPEHMPLLTDEQFTGEACSPEHLERLRPLRPRSCLAVPIKVNDHVAAVLTLASNDSGRTFTETDLTLALELALRAGNAIENARLYRAAQRASDSKSDFLAVMSHELRTPLNAIIGYSDLLLLGVPESLPDKSRTQVERIRGASNSLLQLVEEVLSFSRIEAGKEEIRISPVNVGAVVADCLAMMEPLAAEKELAIEFLPPEMPVKVISDEQKIRQIVTNLLSNAVKFTEQGTIRVSLDRRPDGIRVSVSDTGIGIPEEHLEQVFDPFWQVEQSATRRFGGTGLGLGVARKLATLMEGTLTVTSQVGVGSTFTLTLPPHTPGMPPRNG